MLKLKSAQPNENCRNCKAAGFFCNLSASAKAHFEEIKITSGYPKHSTLFRENEEARGIYVLCEGQAKISMSSSEGKTLILRIAHPGEVLGLTEVLAGNPYGITVETLHTSRVSFVRREDFLRFLAQHPEAYSNIARELSSHYHQACEQLRTVGLSSSISERLARLFLDWSATAPESVNGKKIKVPLTHEEIGEFIGTTRESVTRTLSDLKNRHLIVLQGATLTIPNPMALASYAGI
jgi:CRP/FNR family cyclic AMP-dependent transcriptional regulator